MTSGSFSDSEDAITEINVTPLVDVSLVLVIIFMAVAPFIYQAGIKATQSASGAAKGKAAVEKNVRLEASADGKIRINGRVVSREGLAMALRKSIEASSDGLVIVTADPALDVGAVVELLDVSKQMGAKKLTIMEMRSEPSKKLP